MKKLILLSFLSLIIMNNVSVAQSKSKKFNITFGEEYKASRKSTLGDIIGYDETGIYALKQTSKGFGGMFYDFDLEHYDNKMNLTKTRELTLEQGGNKRKYEYTIQLNDQLYIFSSFRDKKKAKNFLFIQSLNKKTLQPDKDIKMIADINYKGYTRFNAGFYDFRISSDSSKVLVFYNKPYDKGTPEKFGFQVYNNKMEKLWSKEVKLRYREELFSVERFRVDNEGNVYLLGIIYKDKAKAKRKGKPNYKYQVLAWTKQGEDYKEYPVQISGKFITDMQITIADNGNIICAGFYSDYGTFSIKGTYFLTIDSKTEEVISKNMKEFSLDFLTQNMSERKAEKTAKKAAKGKDTEMYDYELDDIIRRSDGGAILIGEQFYIRVVVTSSTSSSGSTTYTTHYYYYYNDIIVININPDGIIEWATKIPKYQMSRDDGGFFSSYTTSIMEGRLFFIFNDNPKNLYLQKGKRPANYLPAKESISVVVEVDAEGNLEKEALFTSEKKDIKIRPKVSEQISETELVLYGERKKVKGLVKVTLK
ncbi:hypothetical protein ACFL6I_22920 [candidate division KSB1 bacterium]